MICETNTSITKNVKQQPKTTGDFLFAQLNYKQRRYTFEIKTPLGSNRVVQDKIIYENDIFKKYYYLDVTFDLLNKEIVIFDRSNSQPPKFQTDLLKAINQKILELGWE